ncbi:MAG: hypothetical protein LUQ38_12395 [Methanotrichaceae archaeon]|nr:hypothetical protein [Methanotrichaceae archaeon]
MIIVEHDLLPYEDSPEIVEHVANALKKGLPRGHRGSLLAWIDPFLEDLAKGADRVFLL